MIKPKSTFCNQKNETSKNKNFYNNDSDIGRKIIKERNDINNENLNKSKVDIFNKNIHNVKNSNDEEIHIIKDIKIKVKEEAEKISNENFKNTNYNKFEEMKSTENKLYNNKTNITGENSKKSVEEKRSNSINNLDKFKNLVSGDLSRQKRVKTAVEYESKRSDINLEMIKNSKTVYELQKICGNDYERMIKSSHENCRAQMGIIPNPRIINQKMLESDIFFYKNKGDPKDNLFSNNINNNKLRSLKNEIKNFNIPPFPKPDYNNSDVFILKDNEASQKKNGEKYLTNENKYKKIGYYPTDKSNSEWSPKIFVKSYMNHNSCDYDLFNPYMKKKIYTKDQISKEANGINPINRQKSITEFVDITRNFVPNCNKDFVNAIAKDNKIFSRKQELCSNFLNLHKKEYNNLSYQPFVKKFV